MPVGGREEVGDQIGGANYLTDSDVPRSKTAFLLPVQPAAQPGPLAQAHLLPSVAACPSPPQLGSVPTQVGRPHHTPLRPNVSPFIPGRPQLVPQPPPGDPRRLLATRSPGGGAAMEPVSTLAATPFDPLSVALLAQQLPSLPSFSGDNAGGDVESFAEWLERLDLVATTCRWDDQAKLVNVATRVRGSASRSYRSCTPQLRSNYLDLTAALQRRFTPVRIQSVQSSRFHERKQGPRESIDDYAQDLQSLFHQAYSSAQHEGGGAEAMGQSVLRYQFVAGLRANLRAKVVGCTGPFDELLSKARFEEARLREVVEDQPRPRDGPGREEAAVRQTSQCGRRGKAPGKTETVCYACGGIGHYARDCSQRRRGLPVESQGRYPKNHQGDNVRLVQTEKEEQKSATGQSHHQSNDKTVDTAVQEIVATMHGVESEPTAPSAELGPTLTREVLLDDVPVQALLDTRKLRASL